MSFQSTKYASVLSWWTCNVEIEKLFELSMLGWFPRNIQPIELQISELEGISADHLIESTYLG